VRHFIPLLIATISALIVLLATVTNENKELKQELAELKAKKVVASFSAEVYSELDSEHIKFLEKHEAMHQEFEKEFTFLRETAQFMTKETTTGGGNL